MTDREIIKLLFERKQGALTELQTKYGRYCKSVALNVLNDPLDAEECLNDALYAVWNRIPPDKPKDLGAYVSIIIRNIAVSRLRKIKAEKRGEDLDVIIEELDECFTDSRSAEDEYVSEELKEALNRFYKTLSSKERDVFMSRYFYAYSLSDIKSAFGVTEDYARIMLMRTRKKLKDFLQEEDLI